MPKYQRGVTLPLPEATAGRRILAGLAIRILRRIYRPGFGYHKAGVMLLGIRVDLILKGIAATINQDAIALGTVGAEDIDMDIV